MHRWQRSADEVAVLRHQQRECERALDALSKVTSCFQQLVLSLGGSADCTFLREEMDETRALGHSVCSGTCPSVRPLTRLSLTRPVCPQVCPGVSCGCYWTVTRQVPVQRPNRCVSVCVSSS